MKRIAPLLGVLCVLLSCGTTGAPGSSPDWASLESSAVSTGPLEFLPEVEPADLRIPLFYFESSLIDNTSRVVAGRHPPMQPFGVDLGSGLAIDSGGSVFLDLLKLLRIDTSGKFAIVSRSDTLLGKVTTLKSDGSVMTLDSPRGRGTVVQSQAGLALKTSSGKDSMTITTTGGVYSYKSSISFDSSYEMKTAEGQLSIKGPPIGVLHITRLEEPVIFNEGNDLAWPKYTVSKQGDAYNIEYRSDTVVLDYKVYFVQGAVYLVSNGFVILTVKITASSILVNGKEVVTYSRG